jgi:transcriptional regulator with XRE-family HTH domain
VKKPGERLRDAREKAGFKTAAAFARKQDIPEPTYRAYENGHRAVTLARARQFAPVLGISWQELLFGEAGALELTPREAELLAKFRQLPPKAQASAERNVSDLYEITDASAEDEMVEAAAPKTPNVAGAKPNHTNTDRFSFTDRTSSPSPTSTGIGSNAGDRHELPGERKRRTR